MTVRPHTEQAGLPRSKVSLWVLDTYGEVNAAGAPLPRKRVRFHGMEKAAQVHHKRWIASLIGGAAVHVEPEPRPSKPRKKKGPEVEGPTLTKYVRDTYLPYVLQSGPKSTYLTKARHLDNHILPTLGSLSVHEANTRQSVEKLKAYLATHPKIRKNSFRDLVLLTFSHALTYAADPDGPGLLDKKVKIKLFPSDKRMGIKVGGYRAGHLRHKRFSDDDVRTLLAAAKALPNPEWWTVFILLGASLGCRAGEAAARKWSDVHWDGRYIAITSIICSETDEEVLDHTKNSVLAEEHPLNDEVFEALKALKELNLSGEYILGEGRNHPYLTTTNMGDRFAILARKAFGAESRNYHRLRHTCASRLADEAVNPEVIRQLMRHDLLETTYGYIQPSQNSLRTAVGTIRFQSAER